MKISAQYFDGKTSDKREVIVEFLEDDIVQIDTNGVHFKTTLDKIKFSSRVGNTPRMLTFFDGSICYSDENDKVDALLKSKKSNSSFVHLLESKMKYALISIVFILLTVLFFLTIGSDMAAKNIAKIIPQSIENKISTSTLKTLDEYLLEPSELSQNEKDKYRKMFSQIVENEEKYTLHFRSGIGINAFALPSGDIIITDEIIEFSDGNDEMIYGILVHEKGHVVNKHGMQGIVKASIVSAVITYFTGDVSSIVATLSASMLNADYSRKFEKEADIYAKKRMLKEGKDPKHLAEFFTKMSEESLDANKTHSYFDSHPSNRQRIDYLLQ